METIFQGAELCLEEQDKHYTSEVSKKRKLRVIEAILMAMLVDENDAC